MPSKRVATLETVDHARGRMTDRAALIGRKALLGLTSPLARRALRLGVAAAIEHARVLDWLAPQVVVDVGANRGQFSLITRLRRPQAKIIAFEPLNAPRAVFQRLFQGDRRIRCEPYALGGGDAQREMVVTAEDDSSSLLAPTQAQMSLFGTRVATQELVEVRRLSRMICADDIGPEALLKIDVQGSEFDVLVGAGDILPRFGAIYVEVSYISLYAGQSLAAQVIDLLQSAGFGMRGAFNQVWSPAHGPVQADLLFTNGAAG